jgi:hypothetical protein
MGAIRTKTDDGRIILIETAEAVEILSPPSIGGQTATVGAKETLEKLQDLGDTIGSVCKTLQARIMSSFEKVRPDEVVLEFGVKLAGEAGLPLVTKGSVEGSIQVTVTWKLAGKE